MDGLLSIQLLGVVDVEAEEVSQLGGRIDLGLPGILALAKHGDGHDVVAVLGGDEVGRLEEDGSSVGEGEGFPGWLGGQGGVDGLGDVRRSGCIVRCHRAGVVRRVQLLGDRRCLNLESSQNYHITTPSPVEDVPLCRQS